MFFHYNRTSRAVWTQFISFGEGLARVHASIDKLLFQKEDKTAAVAFYGCDRLVIEATGLDSVMMCEGYAEGAYVKEVEGL